jgi:SAM-dependent methyltransferase
MVARGIRLMVSETDVIMAYRLIMGREPENQKVVAGQARHHKTLNDLRAAFMTSPEFLARLEMPIASRADAGVKPLNWPPAKVDVRVPPDILERMVKRVEGEFLYLGAREPHWSVLTEERFKSENISQNESDFFESGEFPVADLRVAAARVQLDLSPFQSCFELGCGLGRSTMWLARQFAQVIGGDISTVHLDHARTAAARFGLSNITFAHLNEIRRYQELPNFDVFFSIIVLQHNPPPLMAYILETVLNKLTSGGIAYFQIPTYIINYNFSATEYLASEHPVGDVEVHAMPQTALLEIIEAAGCKVLEIREDGAVGARAISNRLLVQKR